MLLRFGKLHCLGDDLMLVERLTQQVHVDGPLIQQWGRRTQGVGFRRLVLVDAPGHPEADFDCRSFDRKGMELDSSFADLCAAVRWLHERQLTNQPSLILQTRTAQVPLHMRSDGWIAASYAADYLPAGDTLPGELQQFLQQLAARHELQLHWQLCGRQLQLWCDRAPPARLHRLMQPVARLLRGWQLLWLHARDEQIRVQGWQVEPEAGAHDPAWLIAGMARRHQPQPAVRVEWQQECLLLESGLPENTFQLFARAAVAFEGQIHL